MGGTDTQLRRFALLERARFEAKIKDAWLKKHLPHVYYAQQVALKLTLRQKAKQLMGNFDKHFGQK